MVLQKCRIADLTRDVDHKLRCDWDFLTSVGEKNESESDDEGGEPLQQRVEEREFLGWRCGIALHAGVCGGVCAVASISRS